MVIVRCSACDGEGYYEKEIGGDGYGDRCCGLADVPVICNMCEGTGFEVFPEQGGDDSPASVGSIWAAPVVPGAVTGGLDRAPGCR